MWQGWYRPTRSQAASASGRDCRSFLPAAAEFQSFVQEGYQQLAVVYEVLPPDETYSMWGMRLVVCRVHPDVPDHELREYVARAFA